MWKWGECRIEFDELAHWGIKGQKWGVRRYQTLDGSLTNEGKLRYRSSDSVLSSKDRAEYVNHLKKEDSESRKDIAKLPKQIEAYKSNKRKVLEAIKENGEKDPEKKYSSSLKYLQDRLNGSKKNIKFNKEMFEYFKNNENISVQKLKDKIVSTAEKYGLDPNWVMKYYSENISFLG